MTGLFNFVLDEKKVYTANVYRNTGNAQAKPVIKAGTTL